MGSAKRKIEVQTPEETEREAKRPEESEGQMGRWQMCVHRTTDTHRRTNAA